MKQSTPSFKELFEQEQTKIVYFDLDGVLADFFGRIKEFKPDNMSFKSYIKEVFEKNTELSKEFWEKMDYSTLKTLPTGLKLLEFVVKEKQKRKDFKIMILGSTGGKKKHEHSKHQKIKWLKENNLFNHFDKMIFVPGKEYKRQYANSNSFLIDDTKTNIQEFIEDGGSAVLHKNYLTTKKAIRNFFEKYK